MVTKSLHLSRKWLAPDRNVEFALLPAITFHYQRKRRPMNDIASFT